MDKRMLSLLLLIWRIGISWMSFMVCLGWLKWMGTDSSVLFWIPRLCSPKRSLNVRLVWPIYWHGRVGSFLCNVYNWLNIWGCLKSRTNYAGFYIVLQCCKMYRVPWAINLQVRQRPSLQREIMFGWVLLLWEGCLSLALTRKSSKFFGCL